VVDAEEKKRRKKRKERKRIDRNEAKGGDDNSNAL
jgi:hypothetical protein